MEDRIVPESRRTPYYPALDGMRTLAVGMVLLVHLLPRIMPFGWLGVQIFFVLSGFLITGILYDTRHDQHRFRNFYVRRILRIFPLYYGVLIFLSVILFVTHGHGPQPLWLWFAYLENFWWLTARGVVSDILVTGGGHGFAAIGHLWSLAVEEQFYFLWPFLVFAVKDRKRLMGLCGVLIGLRLLLAAYWQTHLSAQTLATGITYRMLPTQWDAFLMGGLLALWLRGNPPSRVQAGAGRLAAVAGLLYTAMITFLHWRPALIGNQNSYDYTSGFQAVVGLPLSNLVSMFLLLAVLQKGSWIYKICHGAAMRSFGRVSYGIYFFHLPFYVLTTVALQRIYTHYHVRHLTSIMTGTVTVLLTVLVSYCSFHWYEKPFLLLKNRFTSVNGAKDRRKSPIPSK